MRSDDLDHVARRSAAVERRLFEILGGWVPEVGDPEVKMALRVASFRHAWHAELWEGLARPGSGTDVGPAVLTRMEAAATVEDRLGAYYGGVLPALIEENEAFMVEAEADVAAGGPLRRVLGLVLADERATLATGMTLWDGPQRHGLRTHGSH